MIDIPGLVGTECPALGPQAGSVHTLPRGHGQAGGADGRSSACWVARLNVELVNAREVKNAPGRPKNDWTRCGWPSSRHGNAAGQFRSCRPAIRQLRDDTWLRTDLTREQVRHWQRMSGGVSGRVLTAGHPPGMVLNTFTFLVWAGGS